MPVNNKKITSLSSAKKLEDFLQAYQGLAADFAELSAQARFLKKEMLQLLDKHKQKEVLEKIINLPN